MAVCLSGWRTSPAPLFAVACHLARGHHRRAAPRERRDYQQRHLGHAPHALADDLPRHADWRNPGLRADKWAGLWLLHSLWHPARHRRRRPADAARRSASKTETASVSFNPEREEKQSSGAASVDKSREMKPEKVN